MMASPRNLFVIAVSILLSVAPPHAQKPLPYRNAMLPVEERVRDLLGRMTLEEKFWQTFMIPGSLDDPSHDYSHGIFGLQIEVGPASPPRIPPPLPGLGPASLPGGPPPRGDAARAHAERINNIQRYFVEKTRLGIPIIPFDEALHGLAREGATMFPQAIALAASWDERLMARVATAIAAETRARGIRQVLSPVVNIADDVRWGRVEETYGEDPYLAGVMGQAFIEPFERAGVVTTPKHFVANVGEGGRDSYPIDHSERLLAERFFPPFERAVRAARARSVMTAYNSVDGAPSTQNRRLLTDILKGDWGFEGFVISDASATGGATVLHMTEPDTPTAARHAFEAGLDVVFQSSYGQQRPYLEAFRRGLIPQPVIDAAVARVLRVQFALGLFEQPYVDADEAARRNGHPDHRALARDAARAGLVLLKNEPSVLPLNAAVLKSIAVIGTDATEARLGGYSGPGVEPVSILDGIRRRAGAAIGVRHAPGPGTCGLHPGDRAGRAVLVGGERSAAGRALGGVLRQSAVRRNACHHAYRPKCRFQVDAQLAGPRHSVRLVFGALGRDADSARHAGDSPRRRRQRRLSVVSRRRAGDRQLAQAVVRPAHRDGRARARVGARSAARVFRDQRQRPAQAALGWRRARRLRGKDDRRRVARAQVRRGRHRGGCRGRRVQGPRVPRLPGLQDLLIQRVASTGTPVVVVLIGGSAVTMSTWLDRVGAAIQAWYPGEMGGDAVADVLFGDANPAGRLPITFPMSEGQLPLSYNHKPTGRGDDYVDSTGMPLFPFGYGLSYTTFEYSALRIDPAVMRGSGTASIRCTVSNTGKRSGDEVVQLYVRDVLASVARPILELKGFTRISLEPGQSREVTFQLGPDHLRMLDRDRRWIVEPGAFRIMVGSSSKDIRLRGELRVQE